MKSDIIVKLDTLRADMALHGVAATVIPQTDSHQSEYISSYWQVRRYFSGFTGSAGTLVVTMHEALLWTDSRYFIQAAQQLEGTGIQLMKEGLPGTPSIEEWLSSHLQPGSVVGVDGMVYSASAFSDLLEGIVGAKLQYDSNYNPARVWKDRPALPQCPVFIHSEEYAGESARSKIDAILAQVQKEGANSIFISALDEIAWTLNLRSSDVKYNPVLTSFLYISPECTTLFIDPAKITPEVAEYLASQGVGTAPYAGVVDFLKALPEGNIVSIDKSRNAWTIYRALDNKCSCDKSPIAMLKACKNPVQVAGVRQAMLRDGAALVRSFMEIERRAAGQGEPLTELGVCEILLRNRSMEDKFVDESFGTIAGYGPHGAIVHYEATEETDVAVLTGNLLLVDSGAQYLDGTTDITRTISLGEPTAEQRRDFTLVMKGHIALARAIFPAGTTGHQLDALARQFLWRDGLTYLHGTGHGVGHFLNVHEGPQSVRLNYVPTPLTPGMITSNEPGLYRENLHGIRCENLILTIPAMVTEFGEFLQFETLTLFPFDLQLFDTSIMTREEIDWINAYHAQVRAKLGDVITDPDQLQWLHNHTQPL